MLNNQIQCPNCEGYKVIKKIDTQYHLLRRHKSDYRFGSALSVITVGLLLAIVSGLVVWARQRIYGEIGDIDTYLIVIFGMLVIGVIIFSVGLLLFAIQFLRRINKKTEYQQVLEELKHLYLCNICGYEWRWVPGEPLPQIRSNPKLREMGEQYLREEEERRRRNWD